MRCGGRLSELVQAGRQAQGRVSVRLGAEVLDRLRAKGAGHLTRINDIPTNVMDAERRAGSGR